MTIIANLRANITFPTEFSQTWDLHRSIQHHKLLLWAIRQLNLTWGSWFKSTFPGKMAHICPNVFDALKPVPRNYSSSPDSSTSHFPMLVCLSALLCVAPDWDFIEPLSWFVQDYGHHCLFCSSLFNKCDALTRVRPSLTLGILLNAFPMLVCSSALFCVAL